MIHNLRYRGAEGAQNDHITAELPLCIRKRQYGHIVEGAAADEAVAGKNTVRRAPDSSEGIDQLYTACEVLKNALQEVPTDSVQGTDFYHSVITPAMAKVRSLADSLELLTDKAYWPFPTYADILFY